MRALDYAEVADKMIRALSIREGEVVLVSGGSHAMGLLEEIVFRARCAGAFTILESTSDNLSRKMAFEVPLPCLAAPSPVTLKKMEIVNCMISVGGQDDPRLLIDLPAERSRAMASASAPAMKVYSERKRSCQLRTLGMGFPTPRRAEFLNLPFEEYHDLFWNALLIDLDAMRDTQRVISRILDEGRNIRIQSEKGTDITFSLEGRPLLLDSGIFTEEDFASGNMTTNWPCGEVWVAPVEESAEGIAVFDAVFHQGKQITDLRLTFHRGKVTGYSAAENADAFASMLNEAEGDCDMLGELGIGTNPMVTRFTGDTLLDEKIVGTIHLALGSNNYFGGRNCSSLHKDMVIMKPTMLAGGRRLMEEGRFCL